MCGESATGTLYMNMYPELQLAASACKSNSLFSSSNPCEIRH